MGASRSYIIDNDFNVVSFNEPAAQFCPQLKVGEKCFSCLFDFDHPCPHCSVINNIEGPHSVFDAERKVGIVVNAVPMPLPDGRQGHVMVISDVTKEITQPGEFDQMTGLLNRSGFNHYCATFQPTDPDATIATIALDITNLATLLQQYGDKKTEKVIRHVARAIREHGGTQAYVGGGRFVGLVELPPDNQIISLKKLAHFIENTAPLPNPGIKIGGFKGSIQDGSYHALVGYAELALNSILGSATLTHKDLDMQEYKAIIAERTLIGDIMGALANGEFDIFLQPKCEIATGALVGSEALVRWIKPDGTIIPPQNFIPLLERQGLIQQLDLFVWEKAFGTIRKWIDQGITALPVSVNVSRIDVEHLDVTNIFINLAKKYDIPNRLVEIEITESAYVDDSNNIRAMETQLKEAGFHVLIDDFGSGYSSLAMLKDINADILKLDMGFLDIKEGEHSRSTDIVNSVLEMAHQLDMYVIVEGVETIEQVKTLTLLGCQFAQGYFFHRPMPIDTFTELLSGATASMIPEGFHGSGKSSVQRLADCFWRIAEVNIYTGAYRFIRNRPDPSFISTPRPATVQEYMGRYIDHGHIHIDDITNYRNTCDTDSVRELFENGGHRARVAYRYLEDGEWRWCVFEAVKPADLSPEQPWILYTWREAADDISWRQDSQALVKAAHRAVMRFNAKTLEYETMSGLPRMTPFLFNGLDSVRDAILEWGAKDYMHPQDATLLANTLDFEKIHVHFMETDEPIVVPYRLKDGLAWKQCLLEISRSVDYSFDNPVLIGRIRDAVIAAPELSMTNTVQVRNTLIKQGLAGSIYLIDDGEDIVFDTIALLESIPGGFFIYEGYGDQRLLYANGEMLRIFACENATEFAEITGGTFPGLVHPDDRENVQYVIDTQISDDRANGDQLLDYVSYRIVRKDGVEIWVQDFGRQLEHGGRGTLYSVFISEVPDARMEAYRIAHRMGITDMLCDMLNRNSFEHRKDALVGSDNLTCVYIDLNGLHQMNNSLGHDEGDKALICVANTLKKRFGTNDSFRIGGDEFAVLCNDVPQDQTAENIELIAEEVEAAGYSISCGAAFSAEACDVDALIRQAETRMRAAKRAYYASNDRRSR